MENINKQFGEMKNQLETKFNVTEDALDKIKSKL